MSSINTSSEREKSESSTDIKSSNNKIGIVVGVVIGCSGMLAIVTVLICIQRRKKSNGESSIKEQKNYDMTDYTGNQNIAIQISNNVSSEVLSKQSRSSVYSPTEKAQNDYSDLNESNLCHTNRTNDSDKIQKDMTNSNNYTVVDSPVDQNYIKDESYVVLDPSETGFIRGQQQVNILPSYELAKPFEMQQGVESQDLYRLRGEDEYDSSMNICHKDTNDGIYSHTVDSLYDSASHGRKMENNDENAYDHFLGQKSDDDYDILNRN